MRIFIIGVCALLVIFWLFRITFGHKLVALSAAICGSALLTTHPDLAFPLMMLLIVGAWVYWSAHPAPDGYYKPMPERAYKPMPERRATFGRKGLSMPALPKLDGC